VSIGAAPGGDPTVVASRIIKYNFPACKRVSGAVRLSDGSIRATCDGIEYRVFTVYSAKEGKMLEVAMNCEGGVNPGGTAAFTAQLATLETGIFTGSGGPISTIVETGGSSLFAGLGKPSINNMGTVAFRANLNGGGAGMGMRTTSSMVVRTPV
jgi:hypothetical protein